MGRMREILLQARPLLPVLVVDGQEQALPLADALQQGGTQVLEVTLRTPAALDVIRSIHQHYPQLILGAGTITSVRQLIQAREAGAAFAVSPGFTLSLASAAREMKFPWLPGVMTPSEVMQAMEQGYQELKLFPVSAAGRLELLDSLYGPFAEAGFCPTGGISADNLGVFLQKPNVLCCGGSWLAPQALIRAGDWAGISARARALQELTQGD